MTVDIDEHSGFCAGVTAAIKTAEKELEKGPLCCLGDIVHNGQEVARLERLGLQTIDYDQYGAMHGGRVLLRAHGEPPSTYLTAKRNNITLIDAGCPIVLHLQKRIRETYLNHPEAQIVIFGKVGHAEVIGLQGQTEGKAIVVENLEDCQKVDRTKETYLFSQTTMSEEDYRAIAATLQPVKVFNTICKNVSNRVSELQAFAKTHDVIIFVGGKKSSNAKVLFGHVVEANKHSYFVSSIEEAKVLWEHHNQGTGNAAESIGICGATSTPRWLMEEIKEKIYLWDYYSSI